MTTRSRPKAPTSGERYIRAMQATRRFVAAVKKDQWHNATPCAEWDLHALVNHVVNENRWVPELMAGKTVAEVGKKLDGDLLGTDPLKAYDGSVAAATQAMRAAGAMTKTAHVSYGDISGADYAKDLALDALIHGWDMAKATGQDATLDTEMVAWVYGNVQAQAKELAASGAFGTPQRAAANADMQTKLLALLGRKATWPK